MQYIVYMGDFLGPREMNDNCGKALHTGAMDRCFTVVGVEIQLHLFLTAALDGGEWSASCPGRFNLRERTCSHLINVRVGWFQSQSEHFGNEENFLP
jgi:hypothetical protein